MFYHRLTGHTELGAMVTTRALHRCGEANAVHKLVQLSEALPSDARFVLRETLPEDSESVSRNSAISYYSSHNSFKLPRTN